MTWHQCVWCITVISLLIMILICERCSVSDACLSARLISPLCFPSAPAALTPPFLYLHLQTFSSTHSSSLSLSARAGSCVMMGIWRTSRPRRPSGWAAPSSAAAGRTRWPLTTAPSPCPRCPRSASATRSSPSSPEPRRVRTDQHARERESRGSVQTVLRALRGLFIELFNISSPWRYKVLSDIFIKMQLFIFL